MNKRFQEILQLAQTGQVSEALKRCERAIKKKPREVDLIMLAASLHAQNNNYDGVIDYCLRAIRIEPKNVNALFNISVAYLFLTDYQNAIKHSLQLIKADKKNARAYNNLGLAYWHTGDFEQAKEYALTANKLDNNIATNHNNLGLIYKSLNDVDTALIHFKKAYALDPQLAEAYYNYGITLLDADKDNTEGTLLLDKALLIKPDYPEANHYKGLQLLDKGQSRQSLDFFKRAITAKPDYAEAYCNLGNALMIEKEYAAAEQMYRKAIEYKHDYAGAYNNLGNALLDQENYHEFFKEAEESYIKAIELAPELNDSYKNLAICYQGEGLHEKSLHYFNIYNERVPNNEQVIAGMASVHERRAEFDEGMALIEPFINNDNVSAEVVLAYSKFARHFKHQDKAIELLLKIDDNNINSRLKTDKYYALGKLAEPMGDIDTTFNYYQQANNLEAENFNIDKEKKKFDNIKAYYTKEKIASLQRSTNTSTLPIFIIGMPRSGTSLAEQVLASHPSVFGAGELEDIHYILKTIATNVEPKYDYPTCMDNLSSDYATQLAEDHIKNLQKMAPDAKYIVDKMPHNFIGLPLINILFPKATVIQCKRSSVDTCLSIYFQRFNKNHAYANSLKKLGEYYNLYADMMEHWKKTLDLNIIELEYEHVIANPEEEMRNLLEKCGIPWDPACLKFYENKRSVNTPSYDQVRRPIYSSSVAKWKKYEHHLGELISNLGDRAY